MPGSQIRDRDWPAWKTAALINACKRDANGTWEQCVRKDLSRGSIWIVILDFVAESNMSVK